MSDREKLESAGTRESFLLKVDQIEPNTWNPNVMASDKLEALKGYVINEEYDPILVSPSNVFYTKYDGIEHKDYVIVDGYWRWKAAVDSGLEEIKCEIQILAEEDAQVVAYGKGYSRGTFDPLKEAELFKLDVDRKLTAAQIAERYGPISESYVKSRLQLLKIADPVRLLYQEPVKAFVSEKVDELAHEMRSEEEKGLEPSEDLRKMAEGRVSKIVPRGTLMTSHLEAIASLPEEDQKRISLKIVEDDLNVRQTEQLVNEAKGKIRAHNRFVKALEEAVQKTCPKCGSPPADWQEDSWRWERSADDQQFRCSRRGCYNGWDPSVESKGAPKKKLDQSAITLREMDLRAQRMKEGRENPSYILLEESTKQLHEKTVPWLLAKMKEFTYVTRVEVIGRRGGEAVSLEYRAPAGVPGGGYGRYDLNFTTFVGSDKDYQNYTTRMKSAKAFHANIEEKEYKRSKTVKSKVDLANDGSPEVRVRGRRFFSEIVKTGQDPFLPEDTQERKAAMEVYADPEARSYEEVSEMERRDKGLICPRGLKVLPARAYETCIEAVRKDCPTELQKICQMRGGKVDIGTARAKGD